MTSERVATTTLLVLLNWLRRTVPYVTSEVTTAAQPSADPGGIYPASPQFRSVHHLQVLNNNLQSAATPLSATMMSTTLYLIHRLNVLTCIVVGSYSSPKRRIETDVMKMYAHGLA